MQVTVKAPQPNLLLESILIQNDSCVTRLWCVMMTCVQYALFRSKSVQVFSVYVHFLGYSCASAKVQARVVYVFPQCTNHKWPIIITAVTHKHVRGMYRLQGNHSAV